MKRTLLLLATFAMLAAGSCATVVVIHDQRVGLPEDELRGRVPAGANEQQTLDLLRTLAAHPPNHSDVDEPSARVVSHEDCLLRPPCSLVVPAGYHEVVTRVTNDGQWLPLMCTDRYIAIFVFD